MAVTKIKPIKSTLKKALAYIQNPDKTDGKTLVHSFGCSYETADIEFGFTLSQALDKGNNFAHHLIQSFAPGEASPEQAHEIGKRLADEILKGRHEYVLTTHCDKGHIHNHLIFCAVNFVDYHKYISNKKSYYNIRNTSDRLCAEYGLSVVKPGRDKGKHYAEYIADKTGGGSWKSKLRKAIDITIPLSKDFEDFLRRIEEQGYEIKRGKYISFRAIGTNSSLGPASGQERFTRSKTLGEDYAEDAITKRISGQYFRAASLKPNIMKPDAAGIRLITDIENSTRWAKIKNLKETAKTLNFLTENNILRYEDLQAKADEVTAAFDKTGDALKSAEKRLTEMSVLMKHITTYQQTKPTYDGLKSAKNKDKYRREHESMIILHEATARALKAVYPDGGKLPNLSALKAECARLTEKKDALYADYGKLKKQAREYGTIKRNVDNILNPPEMENTKARKMTR